MATTMRQSLKDGSARLFDGDGAESNRKVAERLASGMSRLSQEMTRFLESRISQDFGIWSKLADCETIEDAFGCQQGFVAQAMEEYIAEANRLSHLWIDMASGLLPPAARKPAPPGPAE